MTDSNVLLRIGIENRKPRSFELAAVRPLAALLRALSTKRRMVAIYLLCALPLGMVMAMTIPLGQAPDEPAHMARAEGLLHGGILAERRGFDITGVDVDDGLFRVSFGQTTAFDGRQITTLGDYQALRNLPARHDMVFAYISNTGPYFPAAYLPATLGLAFGNACGMSPFDSMVLARLCMLAACLLLGSLALWVAAYGEALLLCLLLLPMTISLAGSLNQDGVLVCMACVSAAALTRDFAQTWKFRLLALLPLILILGSKPPYLPLLGLALLPLTGAGFWRRVRDMAVAAMPVLVWIALITAFVVVPFGKPPYHPGPLFMGNPGILLHDTDPRANLAILLAKPARLISMPVQVLSGSPGAPLLLQEMIGVLGWMNLFFPQRFYTGWTLALTIALLGVVFVRRPHAPKPNALLQFCFVSLLMVISIWAVAIELYLTWTQVGTATITGMQGRYFLVLLPFALLALPAWKRGWNIPAIAPALPALALGLYDLGYVPMKIIAYYYMY